MKQKITVGLVCLARDTYDFRAAKELFDGIVKDVQAVPEVAWVGPSELVISPEDGRAAALQMAAKNVDAVVCISGTFHLGHLVLELKKTCPVPILLWGLPELPYNGGKIRLNSVCGVNLNASNLYKAGFDDYHVIVQDKIDENWLDAIRIIAALKNAHIGIAGFRAHGFFNLGVQDNQLFAATGVILDHYELSDIHALAVQAEDVAAREAQIKETFDVTTLSDYQIGKVAQLAAQLAAFKKLHGLDALAIRCWPEFARDYGVSPCAAMSILQSEGRILACEGDLEGALSMLLHKAIGGETPYLFDFSQVNFEQNFALFWHCGVAPCNLWDGCSVRSLDTYFAGGKGVTADFVLKSGELSIARLDTARGKRRLFLQRATAVPMDKDLKGTYLKAVFDRPVKEVLDTIIRTGLAHHASMVYGDHLRPLELAAGLLGWEIIK